MKRTASFLLAIATAFSVAAAMAETSSPTNEPPAKLIVDAPAPDLLAQGIVWITWRAENVKYWTGVRQGGSQRLSRGWTPAYTRGRLALAVGAHEYDPDRRGPLAARAAQDPDRIGERHPSGRSRSVQDSDVHHT